MPSFEAVCRRLFGQAGWMPKALWGGALTFIPIVNFVAFGYLMEYVLRLHRNRDPELPEWREFSILELFSEGSRYVGLLLGYVGLPMLAGWFLSSLLNLLTFGLLGVTAYSPLGIGALAGTVTFTAAVSVYAKDGLYSDAWRPREVLQLALSGLRPLAIPVLAFWGLCVLAVPLYGFALFLGSWVLLSYSAALFSIMDDKAHPVL